MGAILSRPQCVNILGAILRNVLDIDTGDYYCEISNIRRTKSENLIDCRLALQLPLTNPLKPGVKLRMKM